MMEGQKSSTATEGYSSQLSGCADDNPFIPSAAHALVQQPPFLVPRNYAFIIEEINTSKQTIIRNSSIQFMLFQLGPSIILITGALTCFRNLYTCSIIKS